MSLVSEAKRNERRKSELGKYFGVIISRKSLTQINLMKIYTRYVLCLAPIKRGNFTAPKSQVELKIRILLMAFRITSPKAIVLNEISQFLSHFNHRMNANFQVNCKSIISTPKGSA